MMLPRKAHKDLRKVVCIGDWHSSGGAITVTRNGQDNYYHHTEIHKKINANTQMMTRSARTAPPTSSI
ncbi:hypothetical protein pipiens_015876 [Culex pipiens pipiens]